MVFLAGAAAASAQPFSFGVKGGLPLTDFFDAVNSNHFGYFSSTNRYIVGPTVELRLPFGLGVEFDALYRHLHYNGVQNAVDVVINSSTKSGDWEFPLLLKYRFRAPLVRPYADIGVAWDTLSGLTQTLSQTVIPTRVTTTSTSSNPPELKNNTVTGFVIGGGLDIHAILLHISPEIRYTRWFDPHFQSPASAIISSGPSTVTASPPAIGNIRSTQNQFEFLVGFTF